MTEPIRVKLKFHFFTLSNFLFFPAVLNVNFGAKLVQRILHFKLSFRLVPLRETSPGGLVGAEETSKKPRVFDLVSTTAYSHLYVNGLYGPERWSAPTAVIGSLTRRSIESPKNLQDYWKHVLQSALVWFPSVFWGEPWKLVVSLRDPGAINPAVLVSEGQQQKKGVGSVRNLGPHKRKNLDRLWVPLIAGWNKIKTIGHFYVNDEIR